MDEYKQVNSLVQANSVVDAVDVKSPIPILRLKKQIAIMKSCEILQLDCSDPSTRNDIINWCQRMAHKYLGEKENGGFLSFFVEKK